MFSDSEIAKSFKLGADKLKYSVNYGLAPYFKSILETNVKNSDCYVILFDESLNDITQNCEMDLIIRYFDSVENRVNVRYWDSSFFGHGTHQDLLIQFENALRGLKPSHMYQLLMDGPSVNWKFLSEIQKNRNENKQHELIDIGSCGLHIIHGAFKTGAEKTDWNIKQTMKGAFQMFHDSPARREDYESITGSTVYPLFFCATRLFTLYIVIVCPRIWGYLVTRFITMG